MPQLNPEFFLSQVFWFIITFSFLLIFLWKVSLPRIGSALDKRENKIYNDIQTAKKLQTEAKEIQTKIEQQFIAVHQESAKLIKETSNNLQSKALNQLKEIDNGLSKKIEESAKFIEKNKNNALIDVKSQIQEITKLTLSKLTTINVSNKEIQETLLTIENEKII